MLTRLLLLTDPRVNLGKEVCQVWWNQTSVRCRCRALLAILFAFVCFLSTSLVAHADSAADANRLLDLIFPPGTEWASFPVVKWDHRPSVDIVFEPSVSKGEIDSIRDVVQALNTNAPIANFSIEQVGGSESLGLERAKAAELVVIVGAHAIEKAAGPYKEILLDVVPTEQDAETAVSAAVANQQPGLTRYRFDYSDGKLRRAVTFIDANGSPGRLGGVLSVSLLFSFAPSLASSPPPMLLLQRTNTGHKSISPVGYDFLRLLYSSKIPPGIGRDALQDQLGR